MTSLHFPPDGTRPWTYHKISIVVLITYIWPTKLIILSAMGPRFTISIWVCKVPWYRQGLLQICRHQQIHGPSLILVLPGGCTQWWVTHGFQEWDSGEERMCLCSLWLFPISRCPGQESPSAMGGSSQAPSRCSASPVQHTHSQRLNILCPGYDFELGRACSVLMVSGLKGSHSLRSLYPGKQIRKKCCYCWSMWQLRTEVPIKFSSTVTCMQF
jgi:hypothetical protein